MAKVKCEQLDLDGNPTGIFKEFDKSMADMILKSKAFGNYRVVKEVSEPKKERVTKKKK